MSAATARKITLLIDGIEVGTGKLWKGIVLDYTVRWNKDQDVTEGVYYRIEAAIRRGHDVVVYVNDSGERVPITWRLER